MRDADSPQARVQHLLRSLHEYQRLVGLVRALAEEIERLNDDNAQLHAAVKIYRETVSIYTAQSPQDGKAVQVR